MLELMYWPVLQMCIWGFTASFLANRLGGAAAMAGAALLGGILLWEVTLRSQMGVTISFLEEMWSRNLGHVFVSPLRPWEMLAALVAMSIFRLLVSVLPAILLAWVFYAFNLFTLGAPLIAFFVNLMIMGWSVALIIVAFLLRHGTGAEPFAWGVLFGLAPFAAVFYPVEVLPEALRYVAMLLPATHVFEGMRAILLEGVTEWRYLVVAAAMNVLWLGVAIMVFARQFHVARVRGALLNSGE